MAIETAKNATLEYLFKCYLENPGGLVNLTEVIKENGITDLPGFGQYLVNNGWVKNQQYRPGGFVAAISRAGIAEVKPEYFQENLNRVISTIVETGGGRQSIMEILDWEQKEFLRAHDLAKYLEDTKYFKQGQYVHNDVIIELSIEGIEYAEQNRPKFTN